MGNILTVGCIRPMKSFVLALPRNNRCDPKFSKSKQAQFYTDISFGPMSNVINIHMTLDIEQVPPHSFLTSSPHLPSALFPNAQASAGLRGCAGPSLYP